jgi:catechol 2,3-dioxygenase-like lactoylglutathione lyase family enzyme
MQGARLAYVALVVDDPSAAAAEWQRDFALPATTWAVGRTGRKAPVLAAGAVALAFFARGDAFVDGEERTGVHHLGLAADDLRAAAGAAAVAGIPLAATSLQPGLAGAQRLALPAGALAGVRTYLTEPVAVPRPGAGPVERIDHLGVACADNEAAVDVFARRLGFPLESTQIDLEVQIAVESFTSDKYGVVHHARAPQAASGLRVAFVTIGDCELEFLQEFDPRTGARVVAGGPGTTRQDQGAIGRYLTAWGAGLHHLALKVADIDATLATLARAGRRLIDPVGRPGSRRAHIGFVHPRSLDGVLVHLVQRSTSASTA